MVYRLLFMGIYEYYAARPDEKKIPFRGGVWKLWTPDQVCKISCPNDWNEPSRFDIDKQLMNQAWSKAKSIY